MLGRRAPTAPFRPPPARPPAAPPARPPAQPPARPPAQPPARPPGGGAPGAGAPAPVRPPGLGAPGGGAPGGGAPGGGPPGGRPAVGAPGGRPAVGAPGGAPGGAPAARPEGAAPVARPANAPPLPPGAQSVGVGGSGLSTFEVILIGDMVMRMCVQTGVISQGQYDDISRYANQAAELAGNYYEYFDDLAEQADNLYEQYTGESLGLQDIYDHYTNEVIDSFEKQTGLNIDDFQNYDERYQEFSGRLENTADNFLEDNTGYRYSDFNEMRDAIGMGFDSTLISQFKKNMYREGYKAGYKFKEPKNSTLKKLINFDSFLSNQVNTGKIPEQAKRDYKVLLASNRAVERQANKSDDLTPLGNIAEIEGMGLKKRKYKKKSNL